MRAMVISGCGCGALGEARACQAMNLNAQGRISTSHTAGELRPELDSQRVEASQLKTERSRDHDPAARPQLALRAADCTIQGAGTGPAQLLWFGV